MTSFPSPMKADTSPSVADSSGSFVNGSDGNSSSACKGIPTLSAADREAACSRCAESIVRHMTLRALAIRRHEISGHAADKSKAEVHRLMAEEFSRMWASLALGAVDGSC